MSLMLIEAFTEVNCRIYREPQSQEFQDIVAAFASEAESAGNNLQGAAQQRRFKALWDLVVQFGAPHEPGSLPYLVGGLLLRTTVFQ